MSRSAQHHRDILTRLVAHYKPIPSGFHVSRTFLQTLLYAIDDAELAPYIGVQPAPDMLSRVIEHYKIVPNDLTLSWNDRQYLISLIKNDMTLERDKDEVKVEPSDSVFNQPLTTNRAFCHYPTPENSEDEDKEDGKDEENNEDKLDESCSPTSGKTQLVYKAVSYNLREAGTPGPLIFPPLVAPREIEVNAKLYEFVQQPGELFEQACARLMRKVNAQAQAEEPMGRRRRHTQSSNKDKKAGAGGPIKEAVSPTPERVAHPNAMKAPERGRFKKRVLYSPFRTASSPYEFPADTKVFFGRKLKVLRQDYINELFASGRAVVGSSSSWPPELLSKVPSTNPHPDLIWGERHRLREREKKLRLPATWPKKFARWDAPLPSAHVARLMDTVDRYETGDAAQGHRGMMADVARGHDAMSVARGAAASYLHVGQASSPRLRSARAGTLLVDKKSYLDVTYTAPLPEQVETTTSTEIDDQPLLVEEQPDQETGKVDDRIDSQDAENNEGTPFNLEEFLNDDEEDDEPKVASPSVMEKRKTLPATSIADRQSPRLSRRRSSQSDASRSSSPGFMPTSSVNGKRNRETRSTSPEEREAKRNKTATSRPQDHSR